MQRNLALIDCNNFFVSCEKIFRPELEGRPVIVLSSNDGCAVARSNEAKRLGIPMGAPAFKYKELFKREGVVCFSANFELYGDISSRITHLLKSITPHIEVYSVDESFLDLRELEIDDYTRWGQAVRASIMQTIGVPVSIGVTTSKTLAKLAADRAKKPEHASLGGVLNFIGRPQTGIDEYLRQTPLHDVWGVGWRLTPKLKAEGVHTALDLRNFSSRRASQLMGVHGRQLVAELNNVTCHDLTYQQKLQQMIMRGRQFGEDTNNIHVVESAVASLTSRAASHLRREQQLARQAVVIIRTNKHKPGFQIRSRPVTFMTPTNDTATIAAALVKGLETIFNPYEYYHKADVMLYDLKPQAAFQMDLLGLVDSGRHDRESARMAAVDQLNDKYGKGSVRWAAEDLSQSWRPRYKLGSPRYTSSWDELPIAKLS